jgi:hypothetical protein
MTRLRLKPAKPGTCLAEGCGKKASGDRVWRPDPGAPGADDPNPSGVESADALCKKHRAAREIEMREREARGETAKVINLGDYQRDPDTRAGSVWKKPA